MIIRSYLYFKAQVVKVLTQVSDAEEADRDLVDFLLETPISQKDLSRKEQAAAALEDLWEKYKKKHNIGQ